MSENDLELPELAPIEEAPQTQGSEAFIVNDTPPEKIDFFETLASLPPPPTQEEPAVNLPTELSAAEKIEDFEKLEEYSPTHVAAPEVSTEPIAPLDSLQKQTEPNAHIALDVGSSGEKDDIKIDPSIKSDVLERIKQEIDFPKTVVAMAPAAFPFTLLIEGNLKTHEKSKLLDFLAQEQMGIRELELEPQWASGKILIPRMSEYAAIVLIQMLRSSNVTFQLRPSADQDIEASLSAHMSSWTAPTTQNIEPPLPEKTDHPAELIPILSNTVAEYPEKEVQLLDTVIASEILSCMEMEVEKSKAFERLFLSLQKELKYKAYRKQATLLLNFKLQIIPLFSPKQYRLILSGVAAKNGTKTDLDQS